MTTHVFAQLAQWLLLTSASVKLELGAQRVKVEGQGTSAVSRAWKEQGLQSPTPAAKLEQGWMQGQKEKSRQLPKPTCQPGAPHPTGHS